MAPTGAVASHTIGQLLYESLRAADALTNVGVKCGDTVFVMLPRGPAWYFAMLGAIRIGAIPMPAPNLLTGRDIAYRLERGESSAVITNVDGAAKIDALGNGEARIVKRICSTLGAEPPGG